MYNYGTKNSQILKKDGIMYRFELQNCTVNGCDFFKVFEFSEKLDAWEYIGTYLRGSRTTLKQMYLDVRNGEIE